MLGAFFGKAKQLGELRKSDLKDFSLWLAEERKLKAKSINTALSAGTVALRWAHAEELIPSNPAAGLVKFSGTRREAGRTRQRRKCGSSLRRHGRKSARASGICLP